MKLIKLCLLISALALVAPAAAQAQRRPAAPAKPAAATPAPDAAYSCPMHPEVRSRAAGRCPKCGMTLTKSGPAAPAASSPTPAPSGGATTAPRIPDTPVQDQDGRRLNFYTDLVKGKTVAINFIFTTCTTICPPLTATFRRVQQELGGRVGADVRLISISVDPTTDVPERLKSFADKFKAGPGWTFVTGGKQEISSLLAALGASAPDKNDHTPMILVGNDAKGKWDRTYGLSPASTIAKLITEAAGEPKGPAAAPGGETARSASAGYFPNHELLTQDNKPVRFYNDLLKGKVVLINFIFTTCKGVCPPMTANLAKVQSYLGEHVGKDVLMLSISVDPVTDTPEVLKKYATTFKAGPGWYFLTGKKENVDWVLYKLGGYVEDKEKHTSVLIIGNEATGEWMKVHSMSPPSQIADAALKLLKTKTE